MNLPPRITRSITQFRAAYREAPKSAFWLLAGVGATKPSTAQMSLRDTLHVVLVGRNESADVYFDFPATDTVRRQWVRSVTPEPLSAAGPTYLRNVLPITLGNSVIVPGRYQLWTIGTDAGADLVLTSLADTSEIPVPFTERARAHLEISYNAGVVLGTKVAVKTTRHGGDTLVVADRSTKRMDIIAIQIQPATSSVLVISIGDAVLTVPISAR